MASKKLFLLILGYLFYGSLLAINTNSGLTQKEDCLTILIKNLENLLQIQQERQNVNTTFIFPYLLDFRREISIIFETCSTAMRAYENLQGKVAFDKRDIFWMGLTKSLNIKTAFSNLIQNTTNVDYQQYNKILIEFIANLRNFIHENHFRIPFSMSLSEISNSKVNTEFKNYYNGLFKGLQIDQTHCCGIDCSGNFSVKAIDTPSIFYLKSDNSTKVIDLFIDALPKTSKCNYIKHKILSSWLLTEISGIIKTSNPSFSAQIFHKINNNRQKLQFYSNFYQADFENNLFQSSGEYLGKIFYTLFTLDTS